MVLSSRPPRRVDRGLATAIGLGLSIRLLLVVAGHGQARFTFADSDGYLQVARALPRALWDPSPTVLPTTLGRPPTYPLLAWIAGSGRQVVLLVLVQCLLAGAVNVWLAHRLAGRVAGPRAAVVAALVVALDPVSIGHNLLVATETLAATLVLVALAGVQRTIHAAPVPVHEAEPPAPTEEADGRQRELAGDHLDAGETAKSDDRDTTVVETGRRPWRRPMWAAAGTGLALAALTLTRPNALSLLVGAVVLVGIAAPRGRRAALAATVLVAATLPVAAWVVRNDRVGGAPVLSTVLGQNLADFGVAAAATDQGVLRGVAPDLTTFNRAVEPVARREHLSPPRGDTFSVATDRTWRREGLELVREHPRGAAIVAGRGIVRVAVAPGDSMALDQLAPGTARPLRTPSRVAATAWLAVVYLAALVGLVELVRRRRFADAAALAGTIVVYVLSSVGPFLYVRFRVPIVGPLAVLAGVGAAALHARRACGRDGDDAVHP